MLAALITAPWERHNVATGVNSWDKIRKNFFPTHGGVFHSLLDVEQPVRRSS